MGKRGIWYTCVVSCMVSKASWLEYVFLCQIELLNNKYMHKLALENSTSLLESNGLNTNFLLMWPRMLCLLAIIFRNSLLVKYA